MPSENDRRDKALESIARELREANRHLKKIADNGPVLNIKPPDPFGPTGPPAPVEVGEGEPKIFPEPSHPYFKRSDPAG